MNGFKTLHNDLWTLAEACLSRRANTDVRALAAACLQSLRNLAPAERLRLGIDFDALTIALRMAKAGAATESDAATIQNASGEFQVAAMEGERFYIPCETVRFQIEPALTETAIPPATGPDTSGWWKCQEAAEKLKDIVDVDRSVIFRATKNKRNPIKHGMRDGETVVEPKSARVWGRALEANRQQGWSAGVVAPPKPRGPEPMWKCKKCGSEYPNSGHRVTCECGGDLVPKMHA